MVLERGIMEAERAAWKRDIPTPPGTLLEAQEKGLESGLKIRSTLLAEYAIKKEYCA